MSDEKETNQPGDERIIELYKEILSFRKHNDTILMSEASILMALTSGLIYAYGKYYGTITSAYIAILGLVSSICFLLLMLLMVYGAQARDNRAIEIEKDLEFEHMSYVKRHIKNQLPFGAKDIILGYGIALIIFWLYLLL